MLGNDKPVQQRAQARAMPEQQPATAGASPAKRQVITRTDRRDGTVEWTYEPGRCHVATQGTRSPPRSARK